jgi:hypothetical protein
MMDKRPIDGICIKCEYYYDKEVPDTIGCGECRFGPPTAQPLFNRAVYHDGAFPLVSEYDWCWRFDSKKPTELIVPHFNNRYFINFCKMVEDELAMMYSFCNDADKTQDEEKDFDENIKFLLVLQSKLEELM